MRCFAMAKQHFQYAHVNHKGSMGNDGETTLEKGMYMPVGFLHEKGVYIMLGRRVPNLLVLTSLRRAGFQIWSYLQNVGQQGSKSVGFYITLSRKFKMMV